MNRSSSLFANADPFGSTAAAQSEMCTRTLLPTSSGKSQSCGCGWRNLTRRLHAIEERKAQSGSPLGGMQQLAMIGGDYTARLSVFTEMMRAPATQPAFLAQQPLIAEVAKAEYERLTALQVQYRTLSQDYGSHHPDVIAKRNEIAALKETIEKYKPQLEKYKAKKDVDPADLLATYTAALKSDVSVMKEHACRSLRRWPCGNRRP